MQHVQVVGVHNCGLKILA